MRPSRLRTIQRLARKAKHDALVILYMEVFGAVARLEDEAMRAGIISACEELLSKRASGGDHAPSQPEATGAAWTCPTCRRTFYAMSQDHHHECRPGACAAEPEATACPACGGSGVIDAGLDSRPCPVCRPEEYGGTGRAPAGGAP